MCVCAALIYLCASACLLCRTHTCTQHERVNVRASTIFFFVLGLRAARRLIFMRTKKKKLVLLLPTHRSRHAPYKAQFESTINNSNETLNNAEWFRRNPNFGKWTETQLEVGRYGYLRCVKSLPNDIIIHGPLRLSSRLILIRTVDGSE